MCAECGATSNREHSCHIKDGHLIQIPADTGGERLEDYCPK